LNQATILKNLLTTTVNFSFSHTTFLLSIGTDAPAESEGVMHLQWLIIAFVITPVKTNGALLSAFSAVIFYATPEETGRFQFRTLLLASKIFRRQIFGNKLISRNFDVVGDIKIS
jgi:hypothetical protein